MFLVQEHHGANSARAVLQIGPHEERIADSQRSLGRSHRMRLSLETPPPMGLVACVSDKILKKSADFGSVTRRQTLPGPPLQRKSIRQNGPPYRTSELPRRRFRADYGPLGLNSRSPTITRNNIAPHQIFIDSSNKRARSSRLAGRGESLVTLCCGSVPSTSAGISEFVYPSSPRPFGIRRSCINKIK
jgi:hypothetical protein